MLSYRVIFDGTRDGTRALTCWKQAVFTLAWFRDRPDIPPARRGFRDLPGHRVPVQGRGRRRETDKWYSGEAYEPAGNVQALAAPGGVPLWVSDVLPGSTHDLTAAREFVLPQARPYLKNLPLLRSLRERGFARMSQRWCAIQHVSLSPATIGDIVKSALVLTQFEHKMIS